MNRRNFITAITAALGWVLGWQAKQPAKRLATVNFQGINGGSGSFTCELTNDLPMTGDIVTLKQYYGDYVREFRNARVETITITEMQ